MIDSEYEFIRYSKPKKIDKKNKNPKIIFLILEYLKKRKNEINDNMTHETSGPLDPPNKIKETEITNAIKALNDFNLIFQIKY